MHHPPRHAGLTGIKLAVLAAFAFVLPVLSASFGALTARADAPPSLHAAAPSAPGQTGPLGTYRLVDTWRDRPWVLTAGRYGQASDISSAPDGTVYVLDGTHQAIHVLAPDGTPRRAFFLPQHDGDMFASRLDVGWDGQLYVLSTSCSFCAAWSQVDEINPDGNLIDRMEAAERWVDVAVRNDGRIYLVRSRDSGLLGRRGVDVYLMNGTWRATLSPPEMDTPTRVDLALDGTAYVLNDVVVPAPPPDPRPRVTPPPSLAGPGASPLGLDQDPIPGVIIFEPDHRYRETVPFDAGLDVAVGAKGVFVSRYGEVYLLRQDEPLSNPPQRWTGTISLDVTADGRVLGTLSHCAFEGVMIYERPVRVSTPRLTGALDRPPVEGPVYPMRVAVSQHDGADDLALLQGRYGIDNERPDQTYWTRSDQPQSVQRWDGKGALGYELGICGQVNATAWVRDLALDGPVAYTVDAECVERRPDDRFADWQVCLNGLWGTATETRLVAIAADGGKLAVLDAGAGAVVILDDKGAVSSKWRLSEEGSGKPQAPPVDLALAGNRIYLAEPGRAMVQVRALDGQVLAEWQLLDAPLRLAIGPTGSPVAGDVFALGRDGWLFRYHPDGTLVSIWRTEDQQVQAQDLSVLADGRVVVAYVDFDDPIPFAPPRRGGPPAAIPPPEARIRDAGLWVYSPTQGEPDELPVAPGGCSVRQDKRAAPARLDIGGTVDVTLSLDGRCPSLLEPLQLAIVFDTSRSMGWGYALATAQQAVMSILAELDPRASEVSLITFDDTAALSEPLTRDLVAVSRRVAALQADGDTQMAAAVALAHRQLTGPAKNPASRQVILMITDGNPKDDVTDAFAEAAADRLELNALVFQSGQRADPVFVSLFQGTGGDVHYDPLSFEITDFARHLRRVRDEAGLFRTLSVVDDVPANMRYVPGSAQPPAQVAAGTGGTTRLTWSLSGVPATPGLRLTYRLAPLECGTWPTNVQATADYVDAMGQPGQKVFPIPQVTVENCNRPKPSRVYLPILLRGQCYRSDRPVDVVLVLDTSQSMSEPAAPGGSATKLDAARDAARQFVAVLRLPADHAAVVAFNAAAVRLAPLTGDRPTLESALSKLAVSPGTRIDLGLAEAHATLVAGARTVARPVVILLSDGRQNGLPDPVLAAATALRTTGASVYAIGLGGDVDRPLMDGVASTPDHVYLSPTAADLARIYAEISERLACELP